jgi:hypothetical protein
MLAQLLSPPLQGGFRFLHILVPTSLSASLAGCFPFRERYGLTMFRPNVRVGWVQPFPPVALVFTTGENSPPVPATLPFWFKPNSTFGLFSITTFNGCSHLLTLSLNPSS